MALLRRWGRTAPAVSRRSRTLPAHPRAAGPPVSSRLSRRFRRPFRLPTGSHPCWLGPCRGYRCWPMGAGRHGGGGRRRGAGGPWCSPSSCVLCSVPVVIGAWPVRAADGRPGRAARADQRLGRPAVPGLRAERRPAAAAAAAEPRAGHRSLLSSTNADAGLVRRPATAGGSTWSRAAPSGTSTRRRGAQYVWDYGANQLTQIVGEQPVRLPRARRPDAARAGPPAARQWPRGTGSSRSPASGWPAIAAAGLRIVPATADTTVDHIDIWADPATGLPVQAEVTARGGERPVFVTRFLELRPAPRRSADVLTPPPRPTRASASPSPPRRTSSARSTGGVPRSCRTGWPAAPRAATRSSGSVRGRRVRHRAGPVRRGRAARPVRCARRTTGSPTFGQDVDVPAGGGAR